MIFAIVMGKITGYFPYSFFNIDKMDLSQFISSMKFVVIGFVLFAIILVIIDKLCYVINKARGKELDLSFLSGMDATLDN